MAAQLLGIVEDVLDPDYLGRIKCRVLGIHTQKLPNGQYILSTDDLPWCRNGNMCPGGSSTGAGMFSLPKLGAIVRINREDDYTFYYYEESYVSDEVKQLFLNTPTDYQNSHVLIYDTCLGSDLDDDNKPSNYRPDEHIKVYYTDSSGFVISLKNKQGENKIQINGDGNIDIESSSGNIISINNTNDTITVKSNNKITLDASNIELSKDATESVIKGDTFKAFFNSHKHVIPDGMSGPPVTPMMSNCLSTSVKTK